MPSSNETITSKPVRGSWPLGVPEAASPVVGVAEAVPAELAVGTFELVEGAPELELPPPEPEPPELPPLVFEMWPLVLPPPFDPARGSWYWSSPALWARLVAGMASMARETKRAAVRVRSMRY